MKNSHFEDWLSDDDYFSCQAVLSQGPLHAGHMKSNAVLASTLNWIDVDVLDIGSGCGWSHKFFSSLGAKVVSLEPNRWMRATAIRSGVPEKHILPVALEEITRAWIEENCRSTRALVQGTTAFLPEGLATLNPVLSHPFVREVVFVEWFGEAHDAGQAPIRATHKLHDYVKAVEDAGFNELWLKTFSYLSNDQSEVADSIEARIAWSFPEASEFNWKAQLDRKLSVIKKDSRAEKGYFILFAKKQRASSGTGSQPL